MTTEPRRPEIDSIIIWLRKLKKEMQETSALKTRGNQNKKRRQPDCP